MKTKNLDEGSRFGSWIVLKYIGKNKNQKKIYLCQCNCGKKIERIHQEIIKSSIKNRKCACLFKHGMALAKRKYPPEYTLWRNMKQRCNNPKNRYYKNYGGRGISICQRWLDSFENFYKDMGKRPKGTSIDRIDNNGNYEPSNCRWATPKEQANNKRPAWNSIWITANGETKIAAEWARSLGLHITTVLDRFRKYGKI